MLYDLDVFDSNNIVLLVLSRVLEAITFQTTCPELTSKLYIENELLSKFTRLLSLSDYAK